jgi:hypothetical protein
MRFSPHRHRSIPARLAFVSARLFPCALLCGCAYALHQYNQPSQEKLRVQSSTPEQYTIRVADNAGYQVPPDGRVTVDVPRLERGCSTYLFGVVKVKDASPYNVPAIHLNKGNRTIRKLSLNDLAKLPVDEEGYHLVKVE